MILLEFLNLGIAEIIILIISIILFAGFIFSIIFIGRIILKKKDNSSFPINHYTVNVATNNDIEKKDKTVSGNEVVFKDRQSAKIALPQQSETRYVDISQIIRCEAEDNYTRFVLNDENILISRSLKEYADFLKPVGFMRTHQSHLVNRAYVKSWLKEDGGVLLLTNNEKIPVSKPNREIVKGILGGDFIS